MNQKISQLNPLQAPILALLETGEVFKEYELMARLSDQPVIAAIEAEPQLALFQKHFLIMNALYQIQNSLDAGFSLEISPLEIGLISKKCERPIPGTRDIENTDLDIKESARLSEFYLDWNNFTDTGEEEVQLLLDSFWRRFLNIDARQDSLDILNLDVNASKDDIRQRYRELAAEHHPDKGGSNERFIRIREAYEILKS